MAWCSDCYCVLLQGFWDNLELLWPGVLIVIVCCYRDVRITVVAWCSDCYCVLLQGCWDNCCGLVF